MNILCIVAPEAYHHGPLTPNLYAVAELCNKVAAHVQALTIPAAMRPGGTDRDAELNSSAELVLCDVYRDWSLEIPIMANAKNKPIPIYQVSLLTSPEGRQIHLQRHHSRQLEVVYAMTSSLSPSFTKL